jgi:hypothetical protein
MKRIISTLPLAAGAAGIVALAGCASNSAWPWNWGNNNNHPARQYSSITYTVYYDNAYGPIFDGYWASDGNFYFRNSGNEGFRKDTGGHFRRNAATGFNVIHGDMHVVPPQAQVSQPEAQPQSQP